MVASTIFAESTDDDARSASAIDPSTILAEFTASAASLARVTALFEIVRTPVFEMVASPESVAGVAMFEALPIRREPDERVVVSSSGYAGVDPKTASFLQTDDGMQGCIDGFNGIPQE
jgi:hypothetical protein